MNIRKTTILTATAISLISLSKNANAQNIDFTSQQFQNISGIANQANSGGKHSLTSGCGCGCCSVHSELSGKDLV